MKLGIVSDSHGNVNLLQKVYDDLVYEHEVSCFIHLGDYFDDLESIVKKIGVEILFVPGAYSPLYVNKEVENRLIRKIGGFRFLLTHTPDSHPNDICTDRSPLDMTLKEDIDIVLYGHTHIPKLEVIEGIYWINPGNLKSNDKRYNTSTYALMELNDGKFEVKFVNAVTDSFINI